jgi:hypothetical protein
MLHVCVCVCVCGTGASGLHACTRGLRPCVALPRYTKARLAAWSDTLQRITIARRPCNIVVLT